MYDTFDILSSAVNESYL